MNILIFITYYPVLKTLEGSDTDPDNLDYRYPINTLHFRFFKLPFLLEYRRSEPHPPIVGTVLLLFSVLAFFAMNPRGAAIKAGTLWLKFELAIIIVSELGMNSRSKYFTA